MANVYRAIDKPVLAEQTLAQGIKEHPDSSQLYFFRALANFKKQAWVSVRGDLAQAVKNSQSDNEKVQALYQQGKVAVESGEELLVGINALETMLDIEGSTYENWGKYRLAQLYVKNNESSKAKTLVAKIDFTKDSELKKRIRKLKKVM